MAQQETADPAAEIELAEIESETEDVESSLPAYETLTYPADFTLQVLVDKWRRNQIVIPSFQRQFVWTRAQSSKLIESFLLGLPVPAIFLYQDPKDNSLLVVDGQQRLRTIAYFFEGYFGEENAAGHRQKFRLTGLDDSSPFRYKTLEDLENEQPGSFNKLNDSVLRAFVIKQINPADDTSIYHVFERLNTGGTFLLPQEIRNAIYRGSFNDFLIELNQTPSWREVIGKPVADRRQRDVELILRFLALYSNLDEYDKPMKNFLNRFMKQYQRGSSEQLEAFKRLFDQTTAAIRDHLGARPFHIRTGLNAAVFDSVFTATAHHLDELPEDFRHSYDRLVDDEQYLELVSSRTTNKEVVPSRIRRAAEILFD